MCVCSVCLYVCVWVCKYMYVCVRVCESMGVYSSKSRGGVNVCVCVLMQLTTPSLSVPQF